MWTVIVALLAVIALYLYLDTLKPKKFPPGPKWLPILGSASEIKQLRDETGYLYKAVHQLAKKYCGDSALIGLKIGKDKIVMVNSFEANKEMLYNEDIDGRPNGILYRTRTCGLRLGLLLTDGDVWKEQKRFLMKHLRGFGFGRKGMAEIAQLEANQMTTDVMNLIRRENNNSAVIQMHNFFNVYILNTLWTMMAGKRYDPRDPQMLTLQNLLFDLFATIDMVGTTFSHFPVLCFLAPNLSGYTGFLKTHRRIWEFLAEELDRHVANFNLYNPDYSYMDAYIRVLKQHGESNTYSEKQLVATCMDMFMAGTETTGKSMSFGFSYLVREQDVQKKAQEEIDRVVGKDRMPCLHDRPNMPYNDAIVHESIRHFMGRAFAVPHRALEDTTLAGYNIPKDTMVVSNFSSILMDATLYPDPYAFKPERFLSNGKLTLPNHYFPFGLAKHRCLGDVLAKCNIFLFTTNMLQRFSFLPCPGEALPSLDHIDGATPSAAPFKALVVPRM